MSKREKNLAFETNEEVTDKIMSTKYYLSINHRINFVHTFFIKEYPSNYMFPGEKHNFWEMLYVMDGNATIIEDENVYDMKKGDIIFHMPNEFHSIVVKKNNHCKVMIMSFSIESDLIDGLGKAVFKLNDTLHDMLMDCYNRIADGFLIDFTYVSQKLFNYDKIDEAFAVLNLERFLLAVLMDAKKAKRLDNSTGAENYKRIIDTLSEHVNEKLTIEQIADYCFMSTFNVKKTFAKYSGCGVLKYFNALKIGRAKELIKQGYTVDFISSYLGYSSPSYFSIAFKKEVGISPQKYKSKL